MVCERERAACRGVHGGIRTTVRGGECKGESCKKRERGWTRGERGEGKRREGREAGSKEGRSKSLDESFLPWKEEGTDGVEGRVSVGYSSLEKVASRGFQEEEAEEGAGGLITPIGWSFEPCPESYFLTTIGTAAIANGQVSLRACRASERTRSRRGDAPTMTMTRTAIATAIKILIFMSFLRTSRTDSVKRSQPLSRHPSQSCGL